MRCIQTNLSPSTMISPVECRKLRSVLSLQESRTRTREKEHEIVSMKSESIRWRYFLALQFFLRCVFLSVPLPSSGRLALSELWRTGNIWTITAWYTRLRNSLQVNLFLNRLQSRRELNTWLKWVVAYAIYLRLLTCLPQREYLERCEDRKSYNYLVGGLTFIVK